MGRPLFSIQLKKGAPAPDSYDIKREIGKDGNPKQECTFGHGYQKYRKVSLLHKLFNPVYEKYRLVILRKA